MMTEEQHKELKKELINRIASNLTFSELIDLVAALAANEVSSQLDKMSEEEKNETYKEVFGKEV